MLHKKHFWEIIIIVDLFYGLDVSKLLIFFHDCQFSFSTVITIQTVFKF